MGLKKEDLHVGADLKCCVLDREANKMVDLGLSLVEWNRMTNAEKDKYLKNIETR